MTGAELIPSSNKIEPGLSSEYGLSTVRIIEAPRNRLMNLLDTVSQKRLIYIHAPAGYGKTFSMRMWLKRMNSLYAWIALDEKVGNKPSDLCELFAQALAGLQPDNGTLCELLNHPSFTEAPAEFTARIIHAFKRDGRGYTLVLDDLHLITNQEILKMLPVFINKLRDEFIIIFLSRSAPPDSFSGLVVKDTVAVIGSGDLKFSSGEIKDFFKECGRPLTVAEAEAVYASTEGWAIGVNALLLSGVGAFNKKLAERHFATFLKEQVWEKWDKRFQDFMMKTAVVRELTKELCVYLTGMDDSGSILEKLLWENAFLSADKNEVFRFHHLFREFLLHMLEAEGEAVKNRQLMKAGEWFYKQKEYYRAVEYFMQCMDYGGVTRGLKRMYDYNSPYAAIEDTLSIIHLSVDGSIVDKYPFLLEVQAWAAYVEGNGPEMEGYLDQYYKKFPQIVLQNPKSAQTMLLLRCMDYRNSLVEFTGSVKKMPLSRKLLEKAGSPSITQNMPFFHRSSRDFSEYTFNSDENFLLLRKTVGALFKNEYDMIEDCIRAGLLYEQGSLNEAQRNALSANARLKDDFAPEMKFCAMMILANVLTSQGQKADAARILDNVAGMIEKDKAFYLNINFIAYKYRVKLSDGDIDAAKEWLKNYGETPYGKLSFYKLFQHFTTARAFIVTGDYNMSLLFLKKLHKLCKDYNRLLDLTEVNILFAIAYWKKGGSSRQDALDYLECAVTIAKTYGYTQVFANEGAELTSMLQRMHKRIMQKDYAGELPAAFIKTLHIMTLTQSKLTKGLTGGRMPETLKFTHQQKRVMRLMSEGHGRKEIADIMGLKPSGVKSHMELIYKKLDVPGGVEAVMKIKELGILDE